MIEESIIIDNSHQILLSILSIVCDNNQLIFTECYRLSILSIEHTRTDAPV